MRLVLLELKRSVPDVGTLVIEEDVTEWEGLPTDAIMAVDNASVTDEGMGAAAKGLAEEVETYGMPVEE